MVLFDILLGSVPGLGAAVLSLYNLYIINRGAVVVPEPLVRFGVWNISRGKEDIKKMLFFPIVLNNIGVKPGLVSNVQLFFDGQEMEVGRRVELNPLVEMSAHSLSQQNFRELIPTFPFFVASKQGEIVLLECYDNDSSNQLVPLDMDVEMEVVVTYSNGRKSSVAFGIRLDSGDFEKGRSIRWYSSVGFKL